MRPDGPTEAQAEYLVSERKYIKTIPPIVGSSREFQMRADVYSVSTGRPCGLVIMATAKKSPSGIPRPYPSSALELRGRFRIRGLNYAIRHDCPTGPIVRGWHEHIWTDEFEDHVIRHARPKVKDTSIGGLFEWGLKKWKISVGEPKARRKRRGER
jgi:hypothetical protein